MRTITLLSTLSVLLSGDLLAQKLEGNPDYKAGVSALNDHLNELAIDKFKAALTTEGLSAKDKNQLLLVLGETYIRSGQPAFALRTLEDEALKTHPDRMFWTGVATASAGRINDAILLLKQVNKNSAHYSEARLTLANLYQAIGDDSNALTQYEAIVKAKGKLSNKSALHLSELYLSSKKLEEAAKVVSTLKNLSPAKAKEKLLIEARIDLENKDFTEAIGILTDLLKTPEHLNARAFNNAVVTLADARHLDGETDAALDGIFSYIEKHQESSILNELFTRIGQWMPADTKLNDSKIEQLKEWAGRSTPNPENEQAIAIVESDLTAYAHYLYASYLAKSDDPASLTKALTEYELLRMNQPSHRTVGMSLMDTAKIQLKLEKPDKAIETLRAIQNLKMEIAPLAKQQAAFIEGELLAKEMNYTDAAKAFEVASEASHQSLAEAAAINAGLAYLADSSPEGFAAFIEKSDTLELKQNLALERALWAATNNSLAARTMLETFIKKHPEDLRITEAKLALAENTIRVSPTNLTLCETLIKGLSTVRLSPDQFATFANVKYLLAMSLKDYPNAISVASQFLETQQPLERKTEFQLLLGEAYYRNGQPGKAQETLLHLVKTQPDSPLADYALYYASISTRRIGTAQSKKKSIELFKTLIARKSPITTEATLQLADLYNKTNQPEIAQKLLLKIYKPSGASDLQRQIAVKLAASLHALGANDPKHYAEAIKVYDQLLKQENLSTIWFNRVHYSKGYTYEEMKENQKAVNTYYTVINIDHTKTPITEWEYYYRCGFNTISMLKKLGNPKAAISVAKKLASTNGSRAKEAAKLARDMEMKYMIWDQD